MDLCYTNIKEAYSATQIHNLGNSDHNLVLLQPKYRPVVLRQKLRTINVQQWSVENLEVLQAAFDCTDWLVFEETAKDLDELTETVCGYISFCTQLCIPVKKVKVYANNKPWITADIKSMINKKKQMFGKGDKTQLKAIQRDLDIAISKQKHIYKSKLEQNFTENNMKKVWQGMRLMSGYSSGSNKNSVLPRSSTEYADELNEFYNRFNIHNFKEATSALLHDIESSSETFLTLTEDEVRREFSCVNPSKAMGPDDVSPRVLKNCASQLAPIFTTIFNSSFESKKVPKIWKLSCIIPVPKKSPITCNNDLRPVALTSVVMKSVERLVLKLLKSVTLSYLDPLQFAYQAKRNTEDAILYSLEKLYSHLEMTKAGNSARIVYFDFSSAFNTIQPCLLGKKLVKMNVSPNIITWVVNYLTSRQQFVHLKCSESSSSNLTSDTGAPQGTVLAPFLFILYTSDFRADGDGCSLVKFADDTALIGLINEDDSAAFLKCIERFVSYCRENYLELNTSKTKELVIDYRKNRHMPDPILINNKEVTRTDQYKYLGVVMDDQLCWHHHVDYLIKKMNSRIFCLRKLHKFQVRDDILKIFYGSIIASVWKYCICAWGGNVSKTDMQRVNSVVSKAVRMIGTAKTFEETYGELINVKYTKIWQDTSHPMYSNFARAFNEKSGRMRLPAAVTNRHKESFVPQAIKTHNKQHKRGQYIDSSDFD